MDTENKVTFTRGDVELLQRMLCAIIRSNIALQEDELVIGNLSRLLQEAGELGWDFRAYAPEVLAG